MTELGLRLPPPAACGHDLDVVAPIRNWFEAFCRCGWRSPSVSDKRTALQAHAAHARTGDLQ